MLPSRIGSAPSGTGSSSGRGNTVHGSGVVGSGIRPVLIRAGQALPGVNESAGAARRLGERDSVGMLGANGPGGPRGARPGNGTGVTTLQNAVQGNMVGLNTGVALAHGARFDAERESAPLCSGSDNDSDSGDDDDPVGSLGDNRRGVKREREMEAAVSGQEVGVAPGGYGMVPGGVAGAKPGKKTRGRVKIKMEFIDNKLRRYTTFSKRKTGIMKKVSQVFCLGSHPTAVTFDRAWCAVIHSFTELREVRVTLRACHSGKELRGNCVFNLHLLGFIHSY